MHCSCIYRLKTPYIKYLLSNFICIQDQANRFGYRNLHINEVPRWLEKLQNFGADSCLL